MSKSYCKVCFDAGKPEAEYTSHFVKSETGAKGKVVCPTLLNMDCTYCKMKGHMKSYCVVLKKNVLERKRECSRVAYESSFDLSKSSKKDDKKHDQKSLKNAFVALDSDTEDEESNASEFVEDFPALCASKCVKSGINGMSSYAEMVSVEASVEAQVKVEKKVETKMDTKKKVKSWVDMNECDSDDDDW
jgi:hypothetical protein